MEKKSQNSMHKPDKGMLELQEEQERAIEKFNLFSDVFMRCVLKDEEACQHVLRILTGQDDLAVREVQVEHRISQLTAHDAVLDAVAEDCEGKMYDIEVQQRNRDDHRRRTRFYTSMLDSSFLQKGKKYFEMPETYVFYICRKDFLQTEQTASEIRMTLGKENRLYEDGHHVIYVNSEVDDGSPTAELMKYFVSADPEDMSQGALSERVRFLKKDRRGKMSVCEVMDELIEKYVEYEKRMTEKERRAKEAAQEKAEEAQERADAAQRKAEEAQGIADAAQRKAAEDRRKAARTLLSGGVSLDMIAAAFGEKAAVVKSWLEEPLTV